jgi:hypothetical protein
MEKAERCQSCGTAPWEWEADPSAYSPVVHQCMGCMLREIMMDDQDAKPKGSTVRLVTRRMAELIASDKARREAEGTLRPQRRRRE